MAAPASRPRLSVAIIARDAETLLPDTLDSAAQIADEIIVCDTGSQDGTTEVARRYNARVVTHAWNHSFAEARNAAAEAATGDWILWLDAGERMAADDATSLRSFIDNEADIRRAYMLVVLVPPAPGAVSGEQAGRIRLVPRREDLRFVGRLRETLKAALEQAGIALEGLPWRILRSSHDHDPQVKWDRAARNLKLLELSIGESGQTPELLVSVGEALTTMGDIDGALACFRNALASCTRGSATQREAYYGLLTALDTGEGNRPQQIAVCLEALERFPLDAQLLCAMGGYLQAEGRLDMAARAYETAFEYGQVDPEIWHVPDISDIAAACLSLAHQLLNNDDGARRILEEALRRSPTATRLRRQLIDLHVKHDRRKEALAEFDLLPQDTPHREALRSAIRGACLASQQNWTPALAYLQTAFCAGCRDTLCLRWLTAALIATGDRETALSTITTWQALEPRSGEWRHYLQQLEPEASTEGRQLRIDAGPSGGQTTPAPNLATRPTIHIYGPAGTSSS